MSEKEWCVNATDEYLSNLLGKHKMGKGLYTADTWQAPPWPESQSSMTSVDRRTSQASWDGAPRGTAILSGICFPRRQDQSGPGNTLTRSTEERGVFSKTVAWIEGLCPTQTWGWKGSPVCYHCQYNHPTASSWFPEGTRKISGSWEEGKVDHFWLLLVACRFVEKG